MEQYFAWAAEIKHLCEADIERLYERYLAGEKNADLLAEYKIAIEPRALLKVLPPIISKDLLCPYCDVPMWTKRRAKGTSATSVPPFKCLRCEHQVFSAGYYYGRRTACTCVECYKAVQAKLAAQAQMNRDELQKRYGAPCPPVPYDSLGFVQKLSLLALLDVRKSVASEPVESLDSAARAERLAPSDAASEEVLKRLHKVGVLRVDPDSDIKAFDPAAGYKILDYSKVRWLANVALLDSARSSRQALYLALYEELVGVIQPAWKSELYSLVFDLARQESIQYIRLLAAEVDLVFNAEARAESVVSQLLQDFSVSEIYYFARLAVKNAAHFYATGKSKGRSHAANTIPNNMLGTAQDALTRHWRKSAYRDSRVPQSALHRLLYDVVLKDSGAGFSKSPGIYWRDEWVPRFFSAAAGSDLAEPMHLFCRECDSSNIEVRMDKVSVQMLCYDCSTLSKFQAIHDD
ncbi:hypothetical protein [Pseudomonas fluorescens]|uniref:Uncharacterized protein n=1 Tax=Pseudomonas fluorescens TaxID=294 RepID=A0A5E7ACC7_PSEFL|nr:hypothetical protein [Pseudomonas fluorescens]VVN75975.1 hypothetical protein PS691_00726 [Pseudomonas fluorescens]